MKSLASLLRISLLVFLFTVSFWAYSTMAQTETGTISGLITDETGAAVPGAQVQLLNVQRGTTSDAKTNNAGLYIFSGVEAGQYQVKVQKPGFKQVDLLSLIVNVQDHIEQNVRLQVGSVSESVTVNANDLHMNTTDATVSTVVDRNFAENLPLNGRSFQTLIQLAPGVVVTPSTPNDSGQFSVNGQRANANYWIVDGVGANIGISAFNPAGNGLSGSIGSFSALGGTNSLVSVDALQEFRIQTSTFAPEFGRTPGAQISILTRSGTNQFHGTLFDYLRNGVLDANDWFANFHGLARPEERQNDFGGTFSGRIIKNKTFFFASYEGLRLALPTVAQTDVPDIAARQNAIPALQPYLNAFPLPNGPDNAATGVAQFNASYSEPGVIDAGSIRLDHNVTSKITLFGRYNYSPSSVVQRGLSNAALSAPESAEVRTQTATVGSTWSISPVVVNDLRFNYSRVNASTNFFLDTFGGAIPPTSFPFPGGFTTHNAQFVFDIVSLGNNFALGAGSVARARQQQVNIVENLSIQSGSHFLKFGADLRRLSPLYRFGTYAQANIFSNVASAEVGKLAASAVFSTVPADLLFRNLGIFAQDTWRLTHRLTLTYGLRWDVDFTPTAQSGPTFPAVTGFNLNDFSQLSLAPSGTKPFSTEFKDVAPRFGLAYQVTQKQDWLTVLRGGFGVFYDLATSEAGNSIARNYPFGVVRVTGGGTFPNAAAPPSITPSSLSSGTLFAFDPSLQAPYALQWNVALQQSLGEHQSITTSYIGSAGRRLLQTLFLSKPNANFGTANLVTNAAVSNYNALQIQFQRQLSRGLQALTSYTWAHSIDTASAGSAFGNEANSLVVGPNVNRGASDFDIRNAVSAGITYDIPVPVLNRWAKTILRDWSLQNTLQARSAPPLDVYYSGFSRLTNGNFTFVRPDVVPGQPLYLSGAQCLSILGPPCAGGKGLNPAAFTTPAVDPNTKLPLGQGNLGRNALRAFGATQWDLAVHRNFPISESVKLELRAEMFNVINHPNFGAPIGDLGSAQARNPQFGQSSQTLAQSLNGGPGGNLGNGSFGPLYQIGGPRSIQIALKLVF